MNTSSKFFNTVSSLVKNIQLCVGESNLTLPFVYWLKCSLNLTRTPNLFNEASLWLSLASIPVWTKAAKDPIMMNWRTYLKFKSDFFAEKVFPENRFLWRKPLAFFQSPFTILLFLSFLSLSLSHFQYHSIPHPLSLTHFLYFNLSHWLFHYLTLTYFFPPPFSPLFLSIFLPPFPPSFSLTSSFPFSLSHKIFLTFLLTLFSLYLLLLLFFSIWLIPLKASEGSNYF